MNRSARVLGKPTLLAIVLAACSGSGDEGGSQVTSVCDPVMRFRLKGIDYELLRGDDVVPDDRLYGPYGDPLVLDPDTFRCVANLLLADGAGSLPNGAQAQRIEGVDPILGLAASIDGGARFLRFSPRPDPEATGELGACTDGDGRGSLVVDALGPIAYEEGAGAVLEVRRADGTVVCDRRFTGYGEATDDLAAQRRTFPAVHVPEGDYRVTVWEFVFSPGRGPASAAVQNAWIVSGSEERGQSCTAELVVSPGDRQTLTFDWTAGTCRATGARL
ncbi:MAG: hypothetical protein U0Q03_19740 [Acidimicrobiales bacterium]